MSRQPQFSDALALISAGRHQDAASLLRTLLECHPTFAAGHNALGTALAKQEKYDEAREQFALAIEHDPGMALAHYNLGNLLAAQRKYEPALAAFASAARLDPASAATANNMGTTFLALGRHDEAIASFRQALALQADLTPAVLALGSVLRDTGQLEAAISCYEHFLRRRPEPRVASARIYAMLFSPAYDSASLYNEHAAWNLTYAKPLEPPRLPFPNRPSIARRLKIGYLSTDFRRHVVGYNLLPLLREHDRTKFEVYCYSNVAAADSMTAQFRALADQWREIVWLDDQRTADLIGADGIDILIDTSLHMAGHRLLVFARRPAPIQLTFAGYPGTTGLTAIDYRLTDPHLDPPGQADEGRYSEKSERLTHSFWCYEALGESAPPVAPPPKALNGYTTFGCLSTFAKMSEVTLDLWARALAAVPDARMLILAPAGQSRVRTLQSFERRGVDPSRIDFADRAPRDSYLHLYDRIDVFLDTFPYNGHSTALDSLWMGVPVVSLAGDPVASRAGVSILSNVGLQELVSATQDEFVNTAVRLGTDLQRLTDIRRSLRDRMRSSPLTDARAFARDVEAAYLRMWQARG